MATVTLSAELRAEYQRLFDTCEIRPEHAHVVESLTNEIMANQARYGAVGTPLKIPWYFIGVIHSMEGSLRFTTHLHNGDPLTARTIHVPPGRPPTGNPPFTWEESAADAMEFEHVVEWHDWSIPGLLYRLEAYNGFGYRTRHPEVLTPYLWSFSNHYVSGKYVADGTFSASAVSNQCGAAVLLRRMAESSVIHFDTAGVPLEVPVPVPVPVPVSTQGPVDNVERFEPMIHFSKSMRSPMVEALQRTLSTFPGIFVKPDGIPGPRTSDAFKKVTGHYLIGDPRLNGE
jgi:lysozyme family protein